MDGGLATGFGGGLYSTQAGVRFRTLAGGVGLPIAGVVQVDGFASFTDEDVLTAVGSIVGAGASSFLSLHRRGGRMLGPQPRRRRARRFP